MLKTIRNVAVLGGFLAALAGGTANATPPEFPYCDLYPNPQYGVTIITDSSSWGYVVVNERPTDPSQAFRAVRNGAYLPNNDLPGEVYTIGLPHGRVIHETGPIKLQTNIAVQVRECLPLSDAQ